MKLKKFLHFVFIFVLPCHLSVFIRTSSATCRLPSVRFSDYTIFDQPGDRIDIGRGIQLVRDGGRVEVACSEGYYGVTLEGTETSDDDPSTFKMSCEDGKWNPPIEECVPMQTTSDDSFSTAQTRADRNTVERSCSPAKIPRIQNGYYNLAGIDLSSAIVIGTRLQVVCGDLFTMTGGPSVIVCQDDENWSEPGSCLPFNALPDTTTTVTVATSKPSPIPIVLSMCTVPIIPVPGGSYLINNGILREANFGGRRVPNGTAITVNCPQGYAITNGSQNGVCDSLSRKWQPQLGECTALRACRSDQLPPLPGGLYLTNASSLTNVGDNVQLRCNDRFILIGPSIVTCQPDLTWSLPGSCKPPVVMITTRTTTTTTTTTPPPPTTTTMATSTTTKVLLSTKANNWTESLTSTKVIVSSNLTTGVPTTFTLPTTVPPVPVTFAPSFSLASRFSSLLTSPVVTTETSTTHKFANTTRLSTRLRPMPLVMCTIPVIPLNGSFLLNNAVSRGPEFAGRRVTVGTLLSLRCPDSLEITNGSQTAICSYTSSWEPQLGECTPIKKTCSQTNLPALPNGLFLAINGESASFLIRCNDGFILTAGSSTIITCQSNGDWSLPGSCQPAQNAASLPSIAAVNLTTLSKTTNTVPTTMTTTKIDSVTTTSFSSTKRFPTTGFVNLSTTKLATTQTVSTTNVVPTTVTTKKIDSATTTSSPATTPTTLPIAIISSSILGLSNSQLTTALPTVIIPPSAAKPSSANIVTTQLPGTLKPLLSLETCVIPSIPLGGSFLINSDVSWGPELSGLTVAAGTLVSITCPDGFKITNGSQTAVCNYTTNSWYPRQFGKCAPIPIERCNKTDLPVLLNGSLQLPVNTTNDNSMPAGINIRCNDGFVLKGSSTVKCLSNGNWSLPGSCHQPAARNTTTLQIANSTLTTITVPTMAPLLMTASKKSCHFATLPALPNGWYNMSGESSQSTAVGNSLTILCYNGFILTGPSTITCQEDGMWSMKGSCLQSDSVTTTVQPTSATNSCSSLRISTQVSTTRPTTVTMPNTTNTTTTASFAIITTVVSPVSSSTATISSSTVGAVIVQPKQCSLLTIPAVANGSYKPGSLPQDKFSVFLGTIIEIQCNNGFTLVGPQFIQCQQSESWSSGGTCLPVVTTPRAVNPPIITCTVPSTGPAINSYLVNDFEMKGAAAFGGSRVPVDTLIALKCQQGYEVANGSQIGVCVSNGTWLPQLGRCVPRKLCNPANLPSLPNGQYQMTNPNPATFIVGFSLQIQCMDGFILKGAPVITCLGDASWSGPGSCEKIVCDQPLPVSKSTQSSSTTTKTTSTIPPPPKACTIPAILTNGSYVINDNLPIGSDLSRLSVPVDTLISLKCPVGFEIRNGSQTSVCSSRGVWLPSIGICTAVETLCSPSKLPPLNNGYYQQQQKNNNMTLITSANIGTSIEIRCFDTFTLSGPSSVKCQEDGTWSMPGTCSLLICGLPPPVANGVMVSGPSTIGTVRQVQCLFGFTMTDGPKFVACQLNGTWTQPGTCSPVVIPILCPEIAVKNGNISTASNASSVGTVRTIWCNSGFQLFGPSVTVCQSNGDWSLIGECQPQSSTQPTTSARIPITSTQSDLTTAFATNIYGKFYQAVIGGNLTELVSLLSFYNIDVNRRDPSMFTACRWYMANATALHKATSCNASAEIVRRLIQSGANVNLQESFDGDFALMMAADRGNLESTRLLIENGANLELKNNDGDTALISAARYGRLETSRLLLNRNASIDAQSKSGFTALQAAVAASTVGGGKNNSYLQLTTLLLDRGADMELPDNKGWTVLIRSAYLNNGNVVKLLLERGANINAKSNNNRTALAWALSRNDRANESVQLLRDRGAI